MTPPALVYFCFEKCNVSFTAKELVYNKFIKKCFTLNGFVSYARFSRAQLQQQYVHHATTNHMPFLNLCNLSPCHLFITTTLIVLSCIEHKLQ